MTICESCGQYCGLDPLDAELLETLRAAIKCIAGLTPFPVGDPDLDPGINKIADEADAVRELLRCAIATAMEPTP